MMIFNVREIQISYTQASHHSNKLYQLFSSVKNSAARQTRSVSGLILYAKTESVHSPATDVVISGNRMMAQSLDLDQEFAGIRQQLDALVG
jgi:5-methylcytosine-specific restriction enzyme subunit McrC